MLSLWQSPTSTLLCRLVYPATQCSIHGTAPCVLYSCGWVWGPWVRFHHYTWEWDLCPSGLYQIPYTDLYPLVESFVQQKWQDRWENANSTRPNKLFAIQPEVGPLDIHGLTRREETIIHRLRIGHTRLTHSYLMEQRGRFKTPPICKFCKDPDTIMSVEHILIDCPELYYDRIEYYLAPSLKYLFENIPLSKLHIPRNLNVS